MQTDKLLTIEELKNNPTAKKMVQEMDISTIKDLDCDTTPRTRNQGNGTSVPAVQRR